MLSPYRDVVLREFRRHKVPLNMDVEMPTLETIRRLVQNDEGVAFLPRMCVRHDVETGAVREVTVKELHVERKVRLLYVEGAHAQPRSASVPRARPVADVVHRLTPRPSPRLQVRSRCRVREEGWTMLVDHSGTSCSCSGRLGLVSSYTMGGFIHLLLVAAIVLVAVRLIQGRASRRGLRARRHFTCA